MNATTTNREEMAMDKKPYVSPKVFELGTVKELTEDTGVPDKCSGSGDTHTLQQLSPNYDEDCPQG
jgi:hypothetical protein